MAAINKKIYIPSEDVAIFEEAEEFSGESLSKLLRDLIRKYVEEKRNEQDEEGFWKIKLSIGEPPDIQPKSFWGKPVIPVKDKKNSRHIHTTKFMSSELNLWRIYKTKKEQFVIYQEKHFCVGVSSILITSMEICSDLGELLQLESKEVIIYPVETNYTAQESFLTIGQIEIPKEIVLRAYSSIKLAEDDGFEDL